MARRFGGRAALIASFAAEILFTSLLAPVMMLFHTGFLAAHRGGPGRSAGRRSRAAIAA